VDGLLELQQALCQHLHTLFFIAVLPHTHKVATINLF
jgi:hypothetical protein